MFGQSGLIFSADEAAQKTRYEGKSARIFEKAGTNFARHPGSKKLLLTTGPPSRAQVLRSWRAAPSQPVRTTRSLACAPMHPVYIEYTVRCNATAALQSAKTARHLQRATVQRGVCTRLRPEPSFSRPEKSQERRKMAFFDNVHKMQIFSFDFCLTFRNKNPSFETILMALMVLQVQPSLFHPSIPIISRLKIIKPFLKSLCLV